MRELIICEAIPFGYGPAAILLTLLQELQERYELIVASSGSTYDFFRKTSYKTVYVDSYDVLAIKEFLYSFPQEISAVVSVENERFLYAAHPIGIKTIYVDLFEFIWDTSEKYMPFADRYVVYTLFESEIIRMKLKDKGAYLISPKVPFLEQEARGDYFLLHIGGLNSRHISSDYLVSYAKYICLFVKELKKRYNKKIKIITAYCLFEFLENTFCNNSMIELAYDIPYSEFKIMVSECCKYFTTPGIHSVLLGLMNKKDIHVLFPSNYTQCFQLRGFCALFNSNLSNSFALSEDIETMKEKDGLIAVHEIIKTINTSNVGKHVDEVIGSIFPSIGLTDQHLDYFDDFRLIVNALVIGHSL